MTDPPAVHCTNQQGPSAATKPLRVMVLRGVDGAGGGADQIILRNAHQMDPSRIHMAVCFMRHEQDPLFDLDRRSHALGLEYHEITHRGPLDRRVLGKLLQVVDQVQPTIIHSHDYKANFYATLIARRRPCLRLSTSHGWTGDTLREQWVYYPADKFLVARFPGLIAVSNQIRDALIRFGAPRERIRVLLNGIDPQVFRRDAEVRGRERARLGLRDDQVVLGAVGRIERQKRFDILLDAFQLLQPSMPQLTLLIAGDGSRFRELQDEVQRRSLGDHVRLLGHCDPMHELYQAFDVLVQSSDYEGTPTVVVEAMGLEVPIVATDVGGTSQLVVSGRHGLLCPRRRPDFLAAAIRRTIEQPADTRQRVAAARVRVETTLSYQARLEQLTEIYEELAGKGELGASDSSP